MIPTGKQKNIVLPAIVILTLLVAAYEVVLYVAGHDESASALVNIWQVVYILLIALWVDVDSRNYPFVYRPFEFGFLVLMFWLIYLPVYLWKTRRFAGMAILLLFVLLFRPGYVVNWLIYMSS